MKIAGVDGCKSGWIVACQDCNQNPHVEKVKDFRELLQKDFDIVVVDIPIGLLEAGTRKADHCARAILGRRSCCVFTAPIRPLLSVDTYTEANQSRRTIENKGLSRQTWAITPKIKEVDSAIDADLQRKIYEGHPEVTFAVMSDYSPVPISKRKAEGRRLRIERLSRHFADIDTRIASQRTDIEDMIDAFAMLWSAQRIRDSRAIGIVDIPDFDSRGLAMQIWA